MALGTRILAALLIAVLTLISLHWALNQQEVAAGSHEAAGAPRLALPACSLECSSGYCVSRRATASGNLVPPVCVCHPGFWGDRCQHTLEEWEQIAGLKHHRMKALHGGGGENLWWYLNSTSYRKRYVLAASALAPCRHILEMGGFASPIDEFLHSESAAETATVVDPLIKTFAGWDRRGRQILHLPTTLAEYPQRGDEDGILFIGIPKELPQEFVDTFPMSECVRVIVVEGARYGPIQRVLKKIIDRALKKGFKSSMDMILDMSAMVGPEHPEISPDPDNNHRRLVVLERAPSTSAHC